MNRIMRPAGSPSHGRIADGRVKDGPMSKLLANHLIQRSEPEESPNPAFSIHDFFTNIVQNKDYAFPRVFHHEHEHHDLDARSREDFKISDDIARVILASDETLNPNSALLHKLRPHLAIEPRAAEYNTEYNTVGPQITALPPHQGNTYIELPAPINFRVEGPFDKAVLALLCVVIAGGIAGVVTLVIRKVKVRGKPFSRV
ncbi:hypothetical protein K458DRAFT_100917 [Lentithecium fluviatile CBS 122367]|uniref:Uncharacterized protein n=1 Tax=Lentithecium fluviatile CBS 122367 TaxID=1168545 RepID=A0A6G1JIG7_9PLEO|nr:hypothetical protein K458DRAFT_100917 [Lentithecium fluviatile CBS 122367]